MDEETYKKPTITVADHLDKVLEYSNSEDELAANNGKEDDHSDRVLGNPSFLFAELCSFNLGIANNSQWRLFARILGELSS